MNKNETMRPNAQVLAVVNQLAKSERGAEPLMTETAALLHRELPHYNWVGFYRLEGDTLVLGPFVGKPSPHIRIPLGEGICGAAASSGETIVVDDVNADPRYLACSLETRSEIVVPISRDGRVIGEIDVDSDTPAAFTKEDRELLEAVAEILGPRL